jgi:thiamine-phosphate pyrophosphorylase
MKIEARSKTTKENLLDKPDRLNDRNKEKPYGKTRFTTDGDAGIIGKMSPLKKIDWSLYFIADTEFAVGRDLVRLVREAVLGGVTVVQLRAKDLGTRDFLELASRMNEQLGKSGVPLLINDRVDIVLACGAAGVHLGQDDMPLPDARRLLGPDKIIGISVNSLDEAAEAERRGADYVGLGPIYATTTKDTDLPLVGSEGIRRMHKLIDIPIIAIGGINAGNAADVLRAGAAGVAVVSAILGAADARKAAAELKKKDIRLG